MNVTLNNTVYSSKIFNDYPIAAHWGYIGLGIAVIFYGSNYLPVKQYETGDGMFFQLILSIGIWSVGFVVNFIRNFPKFYALPMLGGILWATGNVNTVPVIKCIGIGLGMLLWANVGLLMGWANARFGWFGLKAQIPSNVNMNYIGVGLALLSAVSYLFVKSDTSRKRKDDTNDESQFDVKDKLTPKIMEDENIEEGFIDKLSPKFKRILGMTLAIISGLFYGFQFTPYSYVISNYENVSHNGLDYLFSMYTGIFIAALIYFTIYCIVYKNQPQVNPQIILPGLISGILWAIANCSVIIANTSISQSVSFPISSSGPPVISSLWGIFLYKEIKGRKNFIILIIGFTIAITGSILCGISK